MLLHSQGAVDVAILRAADATGVDSAFLLGAAKRESGFDPAAKAATSSAQGLFQFVEQTWLATLKRHGAAHGYARYAELIERAPDGRYRAVNPEARKTVMSLRLDAHASALMAGEMAAEHAAFLRQRIGREATAGELYMAHFLGQEGSARLIGATRTAPGANAAAMFPDAARTNPSIFRRAGKVVTVAELYANLAGGASAPASIRADARVTLERSAGGDGLRGETAFIHYAAARRADDLRRRLSPSPPALRGPQRSTFAGGMDASGLRGRERA